MALLLQIGQKECPQANELSCRAEVFQAQGSKVCFFSPAQDSQTGEVRLY